MTPSEHVHEDIVDFGPLPVDVSTPHSGPKRLPIPNDLGSGLGLLDSIVGTRPVHSGQVEGTQEGEHQAFRGEDGAEFSH